MKQKQIKVVLDGLMSMLLLLLMSYQVTGDMWHEWIGAAMLLLFLIHNGLNYRWYGAMLSGKYGAVRILNTVINLLCLASMACLMISGTIMSQHVFGWMPIEGGTSFARMLHMAGAYQGLVYMSLHIGLHWRMVTVKLEKVLVGKKWVWGLLRCMLAAAAAYGLYYFVQMRLWRYMLALDMFVFIDYGRPAMLVLLDHLSVMLLWGAAAFYIAQLMGKRKKIVVPAGWRGRLHRKQAGFWDKKI